MGTQIIAQCKNIAFICDLHIIQLGKTKNPYGKCYIISTENDQRPGQHMLYVNEWSLRSVFYQETLLQFMLARGFKKDVGIGTNIMSLCATQPRPHKTKALVLSQSCSLHPFHDPLTCLPVYSPASSLILDTQDFFSVSDPSVFLPQL